MLNPFGTRGEVAHAYAALLRKMYRRDLVVVAPTAFRAAVGRHLPQFAAAEQQDNQEFLVQLLDKLHEDLNQVRRVVSSRGPRKIAAASRSLCPLAHRAVDESCRSCVSPLLLAGFGTPRGEPLALSEYLQRHLSGRR